MALKRPQMTNYIHLDQKYILVEEAAAYLRISKERLYNLISKKKVPHYKLGKKVLLKRSELDAMLERIEPADNLWQPQLIRKSVIKNKSQNFKNDAGKFEGLLDRRMSQHRNAKPF